MDDAHGSAPTSLQLVEAAPFLSALEFEAVCDYLVEKYQDGGWADNSLALHIQRKTGYLAITRSFSVGGAEPEQHVDILTEDMEDEDDDDAAIYHTSVTSPSPSVEYNILLSATYRVPVLYFFIRNLPANGLQCVEAVHEYLVPKQLKAGMRNVGVMGGISMGNHPITDVPAFFVHPCNTAEAMQVIIGGRSVSVQAYLHIWFGLVAGCVGLSLPIDLALGLTL
ncbi:MAG: hypothetical protein FRX48_01007 [Lasallia pustulata]|uniref:Ubiquitin-like-conjugating enzyme ATG10 n=1 Tax=Lasallia pustulata TaxID=136370 RepID=A0A5M8Q4I1_9LECA|nr:MAG: hypothetical protein FRX48_01007 [Lasallia pustulata]